MMGAAVLVIIALLTLGLAPDFADCSYVITTPRRWTGNTKTQICVTVTPGTFDSHDFLNVSLKTTERKNSTVLLGAVLKFTPGNDNECITLTVPETGEYYTKVTLTLTGTVSNNHVRESVNLTIGSISGKIFIQTDKYLYRPGQKVQFRILSLGGPLLNISTDSYEEVYVQSSTGTRIFQWLNVHNSKGLVHLSFDLSDEVDQGLYAIMVKSSEGNMESKLFKVEDYVLPRYEVTIEGPPFIFGSDEAINIKLCARYTFGEPVKGYANLSLAGGSLITYTNTTQGKAISGCEDFTYDIKKLQFNESKCDISGSSLKTIAVVVEEGTGVEQRGANDSIKVYRTAVLFTDETPNWVQKPYLPFLVMIKATFPDKTPAKNETMEVCAYYEEENKCKNFTTSNQGILNFILPSSVDSRIQVTALNYPSRERNGKTVMKKSQYRRYLYRRERYIDLTNSSLTIYNGKDLECTTGQNMEIQLPVIYYIRNVDSADIYVQVLSRGQVQYLGKVHKEFVKTDLPFGKELMLIPLEPVPEDVVSGIFTIPVVLRATVSPEIKVLVWFTDEDGVVVADAKEIQVSKCLPHKVDLSWSTARGEPGSKTGLQLQASSNSLCSVGVVDKSVELLSMGNDQILSIDKILQVVYEYQVKNWDDNQLNLEYCLQKYNNSLDSAAKATSATNVAVDSLSEEFQPAYSVYSSNSDLEALHMFNKAGFFVMSDLVIQRLFCQQQIIDALKAQKPDKAQSLHNVGVVGVVMNTAPQKVKQLGGASSGCGVAASTLEQAASIEVEITTIEPPSSTEDSEEIEKERRYLPETWLWRLVQLSRTGESNETLTLPDTITEWVGRAICVHPTQGVGLSPTASVTTFTSFFTDLTLPATIKRGEVLPLKISVFNYLVDDLPVKLVLEPSPDYVFVPEEGASETGIREMCVPARDKSVQTIKIKFTKLGDLNITVEATTVANAAKNCGSGTPPVKKDRFSKSLPVEAEGYLREKTWTKYICSQDMKDPSLPVAKWLIKSPSKKIIEGSDMAWFTATGDLIGPSLENIGYLVQLPTGSGEQNMAHFVPYVYALQYLDASNQPAADIRNKIIGHLKLGYQKQLTYRHSNDGSFSAFGERDASGSTWLTAFVVKSFAQARPYIYIDDAMLNQSIGMLQSLQDKHTGCYQSSGMVTNNMLQGGAKNGGNPEVLLSAYVLAALLEAGRSPKYSKEALLCIQKDTSTHPYSLALKSYCLTLAKAPSAGSVVSQLLRAAVSNSSDMRWELGEKDRNSALEVETAAYALLALLTHDAKGHQEAARKIVRWISSRQNGNGGFVSTQDTVTGLQALAAFKKAQPKEALNLDITAVYGQQNAKFAVTEDKKFLQQRVDLWTLPVNVSLLIGGTGCALVQGVLRYNVLADLVSQAFTLKVEATYPSAMDCKTRRISACTSYTLPEDSSNMVILEFKLLSGFIPIKDDLKAVVGDGTGICKRYEVDGNTVIFYFEEVTKDEVCVAFNVYQEMEIGNLKPGSVKVYDYYQPEYMTTKTYTYKEKECNAINFATQ